jgi:aminoglycoside phosphotransferase (APT) family kinase protein
MTLDTEATPPPLDRVPSDPLDVERCLEAFLRHEIEGVTDLEIRGLRRVGTGFSRENWPFELTVSDPARHELELILRRDPAGSVLDSDRGYEFAVLRSLEGTAARAPRARWVDTEGRWFGRPSVLMERVTGSCDWFVLNGQLPLDARLRIADEFVQLLAGIQAIDWRTRDLARIMVDPGEHAARAELDRWEATLREQQLEPIPELEHGLVWLRRNAPRSQATVLVHGDFKPGNAMMVGERVTAMLDWETVHLGDPLEDLGWITNPIRRREHQIAGSWERPQIAARFTELTGFTVDDDELRWWNAFSCWKSSIILLTGIRAFVDGRFDRIHQEPSRFYRELLQLIGE